MPGNNPATRGIKSRLVAFIVAIAIMVVLIAWTAHSTWDRTGELRERLTAVQMESFRIADHFQQEILELNNIVLRFGVYHDARDWKKFEVNSKALDEWLDAQRPMLATESEKRILDQINQAYDGYMAAARAIESEVRSRQELTTHLLEFADFEQQSQRVLNLAFQLATAHRESMDSFLAQSKKSLTYLRYLLIISLALLMGAGAGLAAVVYRELIAPLRVRLVESQALVERQEKLASLGMLATGLAHEIRNPLTAIKAWLFIQQKHLQAGTSEHEDAQIIASEITRVERLVKDVLLFARPSEPHLVIVPAEEPLREAQALLAPQLAQANIRLACENTVSAQVRIDPQQIKQVLINLIQNAAESIGKDGAVTLRTRLDTRRLPENPSEVVVLEVVDSGRGITAEVQKRLFDPFFTTKETGTGLGLSIAARIVEKHGGALQYQTQVNRGTVFGIVLPRVNGVS